MKAYSPATTSSTSVTVPKSSFTLAILLFLSPDKRTKNFCFTFLISDNSNYLLLHIVIIFVPRCFAASTTSATTALAVGNLPAPLP